MHITPRVANFNVGVVTRTCLRQVGASPLHCPYLVCLPPPHRHSLDSRHSHSPFGRGSNDSIVSYSPPVTALLVAMGLGSRLAGITEMCDLPLEHTKSGGVQVGGPSVIGRARWGGAGVRCCVTCLCSNV